MSTAAVAPAKKQKKVPSDESKKAAAKKGAKKEGAGGNGGSGSANQAQGQAKEKKEKKVKGKAKEKKDATSTLAAAVVASATVNAGVHQKQKKANDQPQKPAAVGLATDKVKKPRVFKKKTLLEREVRRYRFGRNKGVPLVKRAVAGRLVRAAISNVPSLQGLTLEEREIFGLTGDATEAGGNAGDGKKIRIESAVIDDARDAVEAFLLRRLELVACLVKHDKEITASSKHMATLDAMDEVDY